MLTRLRDLLRKQSHIGHGVDASSDQKLRSVGNLLHLIADFQAKQAVKGAHDQVVQEISASIVLFIPKPPSAVEEISITNRTPPEIKMLNISMIAGSLRRLEFYEKHMFNLLVDHSLTIMEKDFPLIKNEGDKFVANMFGILWYKTWIDSMNLREATVEDVKLREYLRDAFIQFGGGNLKSYHICKLV